MIDNLVSGNIAENPLHLLHSTVSDCENLASYALEIVDTAAKAIKDTEKSMTRTAENSDPFEIDMTHMQTLYDPASRPVSFSRLEKKMIIDSGPYQPKLLAYPKNLAMKNSGDTCSFNPGWYKDYPYLEYSPQENKAYCHVCALFPDGPGRSKSERVFIDGFSAWNKATGSQGKGKKGKLSEHFSSGSHRQAYQDFVFFLRESSHINFILDKQKQKDVIDAKLEIEQNRQVVKILLDITRYLAVQGLAFRGDHDDNSNFKMLVELVARHNSVLASWISKTATRKHNVTYCSNRSQDEFIGLLGKEVQTQIVQEINESEQVGIIADTTADVSHVDQLSLAARYVDKLGVIKERLISISPVTAKTGKGMAEAILKLYNECGLNPNFIRFQTYDSAANMSGKYNGAQENLSQLLGTQWRT